MPNQEDVLGYFIRIVAILGLGILLFIIVILLSETEHPVLQVIGIALMAIIIVAIVYACKPNPRNESPKEPQI